MVYIAFVCVHNAGRSQMAAAFARKLGSKEVTAVSGGTEPASRLNPAVVAAMAERGFDLSGVVPRKLSYDEAMAADYFITMGCAQEEACPAGYRGDVRDWDLPDSKGKPLSEVRAIRDEIEARVQALIDEIRGSASLPRWKGGSR